MNVIFLVGLGGFAGSVLRYLISGYVQRLSQSADFPYGTLAVNLLGSLAIGFLAHLVEMRGALTSETRALLFFGLLGGFTTFSTFSNETLNLVRDGQVTLALGNLSAHLLLGLGAVWLGRILSAWIWR